MSQAARPAGLSDLHLLTLSCLAVAQPLLDLIGRNAEFLVARGSGRADVVLLLAFLIVAVPLPVVAAVHLARRIGPRAGAAAQDLAVAALAALIALPVLGRLERWPDLAILGSALAVGGLTGWGYRKLPGVRFFLTALTPALVLVPLVFLLQRPIRTVLAERPHAPAGNVHVNASSPVVLVIFDEISLVSLLDRQGAIDSRLFPGFADLARNSTWFRDTAASADTTEVAVPAILTGRLPRPGTLPIRSDHPETLFTLFENDYAIYAHEPVSELAPASNRFSSSRAATPQRLAGLASDLTVVYLRLLAPPVLERQLPAVTRGWTGFAAQAAPASRPGLNDSDRLFLAALASLVRDRREEWHRFLDAIDPDEPRGLYVLHVLLPHLPWEYLPSGTVYRSPPEVPGLSHEAWEDNPWLLEQAEQRYLLQLGFADRLLGELLTRLRATGLFERALVAVTADHGISFVGGESRREVDHANLPEILRIPLFVKAPGQLEGRIVDRPVSSIDILPTLLDLLHVKAPWPLDGHSGFADFPARNQILARSRGFVTFDAATRAAGAGPLARPTLFGSVTDFRELFRIGPAPELLGRRLADLPVRVDAGLEVQIEGEQVYENVDPLHQALPALVTGRVERRSRPPGDLELAVAVAGVVRATTRTYRDPAGELRFSALLPEDALHEGHNEVRVAAIERGAGELRLEIPTPSAPRTGSALLEGGRWTAIELDGERIPIVPDAVAGFVESTRRHRGNVEVNGWAADVKNGKLVREVLVFADRRLVYSGMTTVHAERVARQYRDPALQMSGFQFEVPAGLVPALEKDGLRVAALSAKGEASALGGFHRLVQRLDGRAVIAVSDGREIAFNDGEVAGEVEVRRDTPAGVEIAGWAADPRTPSMPPAVLAFLGERNVYWANPEIRRADVVESLGRSAPARPGFRFVLPARRGERLDAKAIRIVAISSRGLACELPVRATP